MADPYIEMLMRRMQPQNPTNNTEATYAQLQAQMLPVVGNMFNTYLSDKRGQEQLKLLFDDMYLWQQEVTKPATINNEDSQRIANLEMVIQEMLKNKADVNPKK